MRGPRARRAERIGWRGDPLGQAIGESVPAAGKTTSIATFVLLLG
jgi:hypothetical protein